MPEDRDNNFSASAVLLTRAETLSTIRAKLAPVTEAGTAAVTFRNPENRSKLGLKMLPGVPLSSNEIIRQYLDRMERSTLVNTATAKRLLEVLSILRGMAQPQKKFYRGGGIYADVDLEGTLAGCMHEGDVFAVINVSGNDGSLIKALLALKSDVWLSPVSCTVDYRSGHFRSWDWWTLGDIEHGSAENVKMRLDEMADRKKISSDHTACIADWLDLLAERTAVWPSIKITQNK